MAKLNFMMEVIKQGIIQETVQGITQYIIKDIMQFIMIMQVMSGLELWSICIIILKLKCNLHSTILRMQNE